MTMTYNLGFFLGPGFPLGFGRPSGPSSPAADLLVPGPFAGPLFLGPSVGGNIAVELGVLADAGVSVFDSCFIPPGDEAAAGRVFVTVADDVLDPGDGCDEVGENR